MTWYRLFIRAFLFLGIFTILLGIGYPLLVTGVTSILFPFQSHGSLISDDSGDIVGSELIGMDFSGPLYFEGRPSGVNPGASSILLSGGTNYGPSNPRLFSIIQERMNEWRARGVTGDIPSDLIMASASGVDPHLSVDSALIQVPSIAHARNLSSDQVQALVLQHSIQDGFFSDPYVNVFLLNRALDQEALEE